MRRLSRWLQGGALICRVATRVNARLGRDPELSRPGQQVASGEGRGLGTRLWGAERACAVLLAACVCAFAFAAGAARPAASAAPGASAMTRDPAQPGEGPASAGEKEPGAMGSRERSDALVSKRREPSVRVDHVAGAMHIDAFVPGPVRGYAFPASPGGHRAIAILLGASPLPPGGDTSRPSSGTLPRGREGAGRARTKNDAAAAGGSRAGSGRDRAPSRRKDTKEGATRVTVRFDSSGGDVAIDANPPPGDAAGRTPDARDTTALAWLDIDPASGGGGSWAPDAGGAPRIDSAAPALAGDVRAIDAVDVDGDGADEVVVWRPGSLEVLPFDPSTRRPGAPRRLVSDPEIQPANFAARALCDPDCGNERRVWTTILGSLRAYEPVTASPAVAGVAGVAGHEDRRESGRPAEGTPGPSSHGPATVPVSAAPGSDPALHEPAVSRWGIAQDLALPVSVSRERSGLSLSTPMVRSLPPAEESPQRRIAVGPESFGNERLLTLIIDPALPADRNTSESWALLPSPERIIESAYLSFDGRDGLVVTTRSAEKLGLFAEKRVRVFFLEADRTRRGRPPAAAMDSRINLWQAASPVAVDVDQDGRQDLVLGYWKGLKNNHLVLDAYLRTADGGFATSPRTTTFEVADADRSFLSYGHDLDGDGAPELVLLAGDKLLVHPGTLGRKGKDLVGETPRWSFPLTAPGTIHVNRPASGPGDDGDLDLDADEAPSMPDARILARPRFIDLDGDGRDEIVLAGPPAPEGGRLQVFAFPGRGR